jgi:DNA-binding winged helix-turn-helix (wHTH) protein
MGLGVDQAARSGIGPAGQAPARPRLTAVDEIHAIGPQLRLLQSAATDLAGASTIERLAAIATAAAKEGADADVLLFGVIHEEGGRHLRAVRPLDPQAEARERPSAIALESDGVLAQVADSGRAVYVPQGVETGATPPGTAALAVLPVPAGGAPFGLMVISRAQPEFDADDRAFLSVLAELCAHAAERLTSLRGRADSNVRVGRLEIDLEELQITIDGRPVSLTPSEIRLLTFLAKEPGRPRTRREILRHLWHTEHVGEERACDVHVSNLRRKIEADPSRPELVVTVRGIGYALQVSPA